MLRIGEMAELVGVTTRTIRHYHRIGLLPDVARTENGYRCYGLDDAVRLLRIRRFAELGMTLDEVADALADDQGKDLRDILAELDRDLGAQEARIGARRHAIAALLERHDDLRVPAALAPLADELSILFGSHTSSLERERLVIELLGWEGSDHQAASLDVYRQVLGDPELRARLAELTVRFEALADLDADDPAVDALVADASAAGDAVMALLPEELLQSSGDAHAADLLLGAVTDGLASAQVRCLRELFDAWRRASS